MKRLLFFACIVLQTAAANAQTRRIIVAADGSGDFHTVQQAFDAVPVNNSEPVTIFVRPGRYKEKLHLKHGKNFVTVLGESAEETILTYDDHTGKIAPAGITINTSTSYTLKIDADDFRAENITIENNAGFNAGQAVALMVNGDKCTFLNCRITGFQDTLFLAAESSRCYFRSCYIDGTTDFIFGAATAWFEKCAVYSKKNSHITAASTPASHPFGFVFKRCRFSAADSVKQVTLGRPWRPYASVTYMRCYLDGHIIPSGWDNWRNPENEKTARYSEYRNFGPGADPASRVSWSRQLSAKDVKKITVKKILSRWNPRVGE